MATSRLFLGLFPASHLVSLVMSEASLRPVLFTRCQLHISCFNAPIGIDTTCRLWKCVSFARRNSSCAEVLICSLTSLCNAHPDVVIDSPDAFEEILRVLL